MAIAFIHRRVPLAAIRERRRSRRIGRLALLSLLCLAGCHRPRSVQSSDTLIADAWSDFRLSEFPKAAGKFRQAMEQSQRPEAMPQRLQAEYGLAIVADLGDDADPSEAKSLYEQIVRESPKSELAGWSQLAMVRMQQQATGTDSAELRKQLDDGYQAIVTSFPGTPPADEAFVHQQALRLISLNPKDARRVAVDITAYLGQGKTHFASALYSLRGTAYELCKDYQRSFSDAVTSLEHKERLPASLLFSDASSLYRLGVQAQFDVGDFTTARRFYKQFLDEYPTDQRAFTVMQLMKNMEKVEAELSAPGGAATQPEGP